MIIIVLFPHFSCVLLSFRLTLSLFFLFTILHLFANYKAVRSVVMETFNEARLSIVLHQYLSDKTILSPHEANQKEPVFIGKKCLVLNILYYLFIVSHCSAADFY